MQQTRVPPRGRAVLCDSLIHIIKDLCTLGRAVLYVYDRVCLVNDGKERGTQRISNIVCIMDSKAFLKRDGCIGSSI